MQWKDAKEEQPEIGHTVLIATETSDFYLAKYFGNGLWCHHQAMMQIHVYSWLEIPIHNIFTKQPHIEASINSLYEPADYGECNKCGEPNKLSKKGKVYCGAVCWLEKKDSEDDNEPPF